MLSLLHSKPQRNLWCWRASYFFWLALLWKSHALFSSLQNSSCVNKVLLIPSGWLCRKAILTKLLVWAEIILLKTGHNCFSLLSLMLSTGSTANSNQDLVSCEGRISWPEVRNSVNTRRIWPGLFLSQLLYFWPCSKEKGKIEESQNKWVFNESCVLQNTHYSISQVFHSWCWALRGVLPLQEGLLNPLSFQLHWIPPKAVDSQQEANTGNKPGDSLTMKEGEQPFTCETAPWLHSSSKHGMINQSKREGKAGKEA